MGVTRMATDERVLASDGNKLLFVVISLIFCWLLYKLSLVLIPFLISALLAYMADPLADRLERWKLSRIVAVSIVFLVLVILTLLTFLVLMPLLSFQFSSLLKSLPKYTIILNCTLESLLVSIHLSADLFNINTITRVLTDYWKEAGQITGGLIGYMARSSAIILQLMANLVLISVLTFYLLRDWDLLVTGFRSLLPKRYVKKIISLSLECDEMLSDFMWGQLMVIITLTNIYIIGLSMIGLELGLLIGLIAGILSFVPYLGLIIGVGFSGIAAFLQFYDWIPVIMVALVFGLAQIIEIMVLTPRFVGGRIGLHPVAVIFAILSGGQLFGFVGTLLALPVASVIMVLIRHGYQHYIDGSLYS